MKELIAIARQPLGHFSWTLLAAALLTFAQASCRKEKTENANAAADAAPRASAASPFAAPSAAVAVPLRGGPRVYVSNEDSNNISVIDPKTDTVTATIFVGKRPRGLRLSPDGQTLYVALSGSPKEPPGARDGGRAASSAGDRAADGIALVDIAQETLIRTIASGRDPESFDFTPDGKILYASNEETAQASVVDLATGQVTKTIALDEEPEGVTVNPTGDVVYITSEAANKVFAVDTRSNKVKVTIETGPRPRGVVFTPDGARGYITEEQGSSISVVDAKRHKIIGHINLDAPAHKPMGIVASPNGKTVFVTTGRGGSVVYIDTETNRVVKKVDDVGTRPWGIGVTADGEKLYTANGPSNDVSVIDVPSGKILTRVKVGSFPWGIAISKK